MRSQWSVSYDSEWEVSDHFEWETRGSRRVRGGSGAEGGRGAVPRPALRAWRRPDRLSK